MYTIGFTMISYLISYDFTMGSIPANVIVYIGDIMVLVVSLCSAAYMAVKTTEAVITFGEGYAYIYRQGSIVGNYMGQFEVVFAFLFYMLPMGLAIIATYGAMHIWDMVEERDTAVADEGFMGASVSVRDCMKFVALGIVVMVTTYWASWSIGDVVDELIGWFDKWDDKKFSEGTDKTTGVADIAGTSLMTDLQMHAATVVYSWMVFTWIILGSHIFAYMYLGFDRLENCNLDDVNESYYEPVRSLVASEVDLPSCKKAVKAIFRIADLDGSNSISRCETAKFLYGMGNSSEYALKYSEAKTLP